MDGFQHRAGRNFNKRGMRNTLLSLRNGQTLTRNVEHAEQAKFRILNVRNAELSIEQAEFRI